MRYHSATLDRPLFMEAAARIEALEAEVRKWHRAYVEARDLARTALDKDAG
jgi:hypothetical protein